MRRDPYEGYEDARKMARSGERSVGMEGGHAWDSFELGGLEYSAIASAMRWVDHDATNEPLALPSRTRIVYAWGDATHRVSNDKTIIAHIVDTTGAWGKGFTMSVSRRWSAPEVQYRHWHRSKRGFELGSVQLVRVDETCWVANLLAQKGRKRTAKSGPLVRYSAVQQALQELGARAVELDASVQMPRMGTGLAGGEWADIEPHVETLAAQVPTTVYDYA